MASGPETADELAIRGLVARYADAVNRRDERAWEATWAEDGIWELMGSAIEGRDAVVTAWKGAMAGLPLVFHQVHTGVVELNGERAFGRWSVSELARTGGGDAIQLLALYHDAYHREAVGWRFSRRRLEVLYQGPPDLSAGA